MLVQLYIENVAVIQKAAIALAPGFNVFTGETGAGKTMLISAIDAVLGERTSREIIRTGEDKAVVSAMFEHLSPEAVGKLEGLGYSDDEGALLITREITAAGKTSCKINGMPATTSILREIAPLLIHIHGQRDSQQLLLPERHQELVDAFGELRPRVEAYGEAYRQLRETERVLGELNVDGAQKAQRMDMLSFQIEEIESAALEDEQEEDTLLARRKVIQGSEKILEGLAAAYAALSGGEEEEGVNDRWDSLLGGILTAAQYVERFEPMAARLQEMGYELADFTGEIRSYLDEFDFDPRELNDIEYRLDLIYKLKRKYGTSVAEILEYLDAARRELEDIGGSDERKAKLEERRSALAAEAGKLAAALTRERKKAAKAFMSQVEEQLAFLDMPSVKLSASLEPRELGPTGADNLELFISTNVGEPPKPLAKIASGGEIARIMLAVKNVLADRDHIDTLIFDEVDTGVSGRAAQKIGRKLREVSADRQVIAVTHLAQVASYADAHLLISKTAEKGRTFTQVESLDEQGKIEELARIQSGDLLTDTALQNARELWEHSQNDASPH